MHSGLANSVVFFEDERIFFPSYQTCELHNSTFSPIVLPGQLSVLSSCSASFFDSSKAVYFHGPLGFNALLYSTRFSIFYI